MSDVFQLLGTLRNKLRCTLRHLRQQLRHSLRASEIRLRRTVRTDFLLRVPAALVLVICAAPGVRCRWPSRGAYAIRALPDLCFGIVSGRLWRLLDFRISLLKPRHARGFLFTLYTAAPNALV